MSSVETLVSARRKAIVSARRKHIVSARREPIVSARLRAPVSFLPFSYCSSKVERFASVARLSAPHVTVVAGVFLAQPSPDSSVNEDEAPRSTRTRLLGQ